MASSKTIFVCANCGASYPRWTGQCSACGQWNTLEEKTETKTAGKKRANSGAMPISAASARQLAGKPLARLSTNFEELNRVLGGGVVPGSFVLLGGEPGIGKSTLTLQLAAHFAVTNGIVLLASGEESAEQIALRAHRTGCAVEALQLISLNDTDQLLATAEATRPALLIVDSAQVFSSSELPSQPGSLPQIRNLAETLLRFAKSTGTPVILIGHVTKDGELAGPQVLSHLVDVVLQLEGDPHRDLRFLRANKNRFGATSEVGVFKMAEKGLEDVANPSEFFLTSREAGVAGSCITCTVEGTRPVLVEVQALTAPSVFGYPKRAASGFNLNRLNLILAVLQRHAGLKLDSSDVYINVVGGFRLGEPAADLAVALAIASSRLQKPVPENIVAWGEVGLTGEIRPAAQSELRARETKKMGLQPANPKTKRLEKALSELLG